MKTPKQDRDINHLDPPFRVLVEIFLEECKKQDLHIFITETKRTKARQKYLFSLGRTLPGNKVTWTLQSKHIEGHAIDIAFKEENHGSLYPNDIKLWNKVFDIGEKYGIVSLYRKYEIEKAHLEWDETKKYRNTSEFKKYKSIKLDHMTDEQKQLLEAYLYDAKSVYNYGSKEMKEMAERHANEIRELLKK